MNLSQLRKLVEATRHLPDNTVLVSAADQTFEEVHDIKERKVLVFQRPRSQCPFGAIFHQPLKPEVFGFRTQEELNGVARIETVLEVS